MTDPDPDPGAPADPLASRWQPLALGEAECLAETLYGVAGRATRMSSERDETFRLDAADGRRFTLKVANPAEDPAALAFQDDVLRFLAETAPDLPVPRIVPALALSSPPDGSRRIVRLLTYLDGRQLHERQPSMETLEHLGRMLAALGLALAACPHRPPPIRLAWDLSHFPDLADRLDIVGPERRPLVGAVLSDYAERVLPRRDELARQIIHSDFNPYNILVDEAEPARVAGIIDFGDMVEAARVFDLAIAAAYHLSGEDWRDRLAAVVRGYGALRPLTDDEVAVLPVLIRARLATSIIMGEWRASLHRENRDYVLRNHAVALRGLINLSGASEGHVEDILMQSREG
ncbi:MAG: phosphotransferase [Janthinobacterium lividum]